ncbi:MAG: thymidine phosphorylase, partial [Clostridia bacterium]|nr:thymidine phosphorylase [Clostridia bacterium]
YNSGIILNKKVGDKIDKNEILGVLYSRNISKIKQAEEIFRKSFIISYEKPKKNEFIYKIITEKEC